jgi:SAM-dependent methyltransferase
MKITDVESEKYRKANDIPQYHVISPGFNYVDNFAKISGCRSGETLVDVGCGPAKASVKLVEEYGLKVALFDLIPDAIVPEAKHLPFHQGSLWRELPIPSSKYGYCCDVMEHLPEQFVMVAIMNMLQKCEYLFMSIAHFEENHGPQIGEVLHLTVKPFIWWRDSLREVCQVLDARDQILSSIFYVKAFDEQT